MGFTDVALKLYVLTVLMYDGAFYLYQFLGLCDFLTRKMQEFEIYFGHKSC
jgi:hypothetical protein